MTARDFYFQVVRPCYDEHKQAMQALSDLWTADRNSPSVPDAARRLHRRTMTAALWAYHLHEWVLLDQARPAVTVDPGRAEAYRGELIRLCPDFAVLRDAVDAYKHGALRNGARVPSIAGDVTTAAPAFGALPWGEFDWHHRPQTTVPAPGGATGHRRSLEAILASVMAMWADLDAKGEIPSGA
ncbi:MAG: hypothetical protein OHK0024_32710 [Thalassobaculales bacterium]